MRKNRIKISEFVRNHLKDKDYWDELGDREKAELNQAIAESEDESNLVDHTEVMKKYSRWLGK